MRFLTRSFIILLCVAFTLPACETLETAFPTENKPPNAQKSKPGPPDHAPAHGHRKKHKKDKVDLTYDAPSGVYVVIGYTNHFFSGDLYYRISGENWEISAGIAGPWKTTTEAKVPKGIKHKKGKNKGKAKGKGKGKGKGNKK